MSNLEALQQAVVSSGWSAVNALAFDVARSRVKFNPRTTSIILFFTRGGRLIKVRLSVVTSSALRVSIRASLVIRHKIHDLACWLSLKLRIAHTIYRPCLGVRKSDSQYEES